MIDVDHSEWKLTSSEVKNELATCHYVFKMDENVKLGSIPDKMPPSIFFSCYVIRLLFNLALDNYEK